MEKNGSTARKYQRIRIMVFADMAARKVSASGHGPRVSRLKMTPKLCSAASHRMTDFELHN
jgi:hypothetical protein